MENPAIGHPAPPAGVMDGTDVDIPLFKVNAPCTLMPVDPVKRWATISDDGRYRWVLGREWANNGDHMATFIMLNPSTADGELDDPTIRRCIGFAKAWGCDGLLVGNLYAYRATDPRDLWKADEPTGGDRNDAMIQELILRARARKDPLVAAWGANARPERVRAVRSMRGSDWFTALGTTKDGAPRHPLYLPASSLRQAWP